ncbi:GHMP family kinase ATP-binding protein [Xaviernesmea oryzae]|uniref:Threonine kinase n=1 Tax=Xaviernesmea oryzae TaxID=464029 RepID=A0A1X7FUY7_9HYPH|nr:GHMP kinase [Xaviernesmea oryzae]SMF59211.1 threonine kinase [Xaviernesmea oryzae]
MSAKSGIGKAMAHHGELLQGVFDHIDGYLRRGLVSLPYPALTSLATFTPNARAEITVSPTGREKARRAADLTIASFAQVRTGGHIQLVSDIPIGRGMGSSTADVLASIQAVLDYLRVFPTAEHIMRIAVDAETACDSTLFKQQAVLFAQRDGIVLEVFRKPLPALNILSVDTTPESTVSTVEFEPARYCPAEIEMFRPLRSLLRKAIDSGDVRSLGRVATASAVINERFLPKPGLRELQAIASRYDAAGLQVAHSGTMAGLIFDPEDDRAPENMHLARKAIDALGLVSAPLKLERA